MPEPTSSYRIDKALTPTIKAVIFDLDGTLLDTELLSDRAILDSFGDSLPFEERLKNEAGNGGVLPWEIKKQILGMRGNEWIPMVIRFAHERWGVALPESWNVRTGDSRVVGDSESQSESTEGVNLRAPEVDELWRRWEVRLNELCKNVEECQGAGQLVEDLDKLGLPLAIATSSRLAAVEKKRIKHEELFRRIRVIVTGDDPRVHHGKPAPDIYIETARRLGVKPSECLVFEDAMTGVRAAKEAGCHVVAVPDPRMEKSAFFSLADEVLNNLSEFRVDHWGLDTYRSNVDASTIRN